MKRAFDSLKAYARSFGGGSDVNLLLTGPPGVGKTLLAGCVARTVAERGFSVVYDTVPSILRAMEEEKFGRGDSERNEASIKRYRECDLLIADDLGSEMITAFTISAVYDVINHRLINNKKTIITTNLSIADIAETYTPAITSRLAGQYMIMEFYGEDIRLLKKNANRGLSVNNANY